MTGDVPRSELRVRFEVLNTELGRRAIDCELCTVGGAVMSIVFRTEPSTRHIRALFGPESLLREAAESVAAALNLPARWTPETVHAYIGPGPDSQAFVELSHLKVYAARPEYLLAMKCAALRLGPEAGGRDDLQYLLRYLNLSSGEDALRVVHHYFNERQLPADVRETVDALLYN